MQFVYIQLVRSDNINPFINMVSKFSRKSLDSHLPPSMQFYMQGQRIQKLVEQSANISIKAQFANQRIIDALMEDQIAARKSIKNKNKFNKMNMQQKEFEVKRIYIAFFMIQFRSLLCMQDRMLSNFIKKKKFSKEQRQNIITRQVTIQKRIHYFDDETPL